MGRWLGLLVAIGLLGSHCARAQSRVIDSLQVVLGAAHRQDTVRVRALQALSNELMLSNLPKAISLLEQALLLSRQLVDPRGEGKALVRLGTLYRRQANYEQARRYTREAQTFFTSRKDNVGLGKTYLQLSFIEADQGNLPTALRNALQGLPYAEKGNDHVTQARLQAELGNIYVELGNYDDAIPVLLTTLKNGEKLKDAFVMATALSLLGKAYHMLGDWPKSLRYYHQAVALNQKLGDSQSVIIDETNLADLYSKQGNYQQAFAFSIQARALARTNKDSFNLPPAELAVARAYLATNQLDSAVALARHGFQLSERWHTRSNANLSSASDILAQAYARRGDFAQAYRYQSLWVSYQDSLAGAETQRKTSALRYGYELDRKQDQITLLTQARLLQRQQLWSLLAGLVATVLVVGLLVRNIYLKQRANRVLGEKNAYIAHQRDNLDRALVELRATQSQLVQTEKMVALAALTAGVAHEIQNPLNFINNFSETGLELATELEVETQRPTRDAALEADLLADIKQNLLIINQHGSRAGDIVKGMLEHAHADKGQRQPLDLNKTAEEYLRLAYQNLQLKNQNFTFTRTLDLDPRLGLLPLVPQEIGRVLLNLFANAVYAVRQKAARLGAAYVPEVRVSTARQGGQVVLRVRDNGTGIPAAVVSKIFDPFFTTKPPGEGTGLGLWFSYDIITKSYGGTLTVATREGEYTEFTLTLPAAPTHPPAAEAPAVGRLVAASED